MINGRGRGNSPSIPRYIRPLRLQPQSPAFGIARHRQMGERDVIVWGAEFVQRRRRDSRKPLKSLLGAAGIEPATPPV